MINFADKHSLTKRQYPYYQQAPMLRAYADPYQRSRVSRKRPPRVGKKGNSLLT